jgi:hypothetical protein
VDATPVFFLLVSNVILQANPLEASPANHDISKDKSENEGGTGNPAQGQVTKSRESAASSGGGGAPKAGGSKSG